MRFRNFFMIIIVGLSIAMMFLMDPDSKIITDLSWGATAVAGLSSITAIFIFVSVLYISRRGLLDYLDLSKYFEKALETAQGAGLALIAVGLMMVSIGLMAIAAMMKF